MIKSLFKWYIRNHILRVVQREFYILMRNITRRNVSLRSMCCFSPKTYIRYQAILRINAKHIMSCHGKIPLPVPCTHIIAIDSLHTIFPIAYILCLISHIPYDRIFISTLSPIHIQIHQFPCAFPSSPSVSGFISAKSIRMWNGYILSIISCVNHSNTVIILITHQQFFRKRIKRISEHTIIFYYNTFILIIKQPIYGRINSHTTTKILFLK